MALKNNLKDSKPEIESIDKQQKDASFISGLLSKPFLVRSYKYLFLNKKQKLLYRQMLNKSKKNIDDLKKNFNRDNIFEIENFNF
jgi:hypothetical protein